MAGKSTNQNSTTKTTAAKNAQRAQKTTGKTRAQAAVSNNREDDRIDTRNRLAGRLIASLILTLLAIFLVITMFGVEAALLDLLKNVTRGLFGYGYYLMPFAFLFIVWLMLYHTDVSVRFRTATICLIVVFFSSLLHIFLYNGTATGAKVISALWTMGIDGRSGGVIPGLIAMGLKFLLSKVGATIVLILLTAICVFIGFHISATLLLHKRAEKKRERLEQQELERPAPVALTREDTLQDLRTLATPPKFPDYSERSRRRQESFDIEMGEPPRKVSEKRSPALPEQAADEDLIFFRPNSSRNKPGKKAKSKPKPSPFDIPIGGDDYTAQIQRLAREEMGIPEEPDPDPQEELDLPFIPTNFPETDAGKFEIPHVEDTTAARSRRAGEQPQKIPQSEIESGARQAVKDGKLSAGEAEVAAEEIKKQIEAQEDAEAQAQPVYHFPPMTMLAEAMNSKEDNTEEMRSNVLRLEETLSSFGVDVKVENVVRGPTVTRYEMQLKPGIKMSKITTLHQDIALSLGVSSVRVSAVEGKSSVIGIEVPNRITTSVPIRDVLESKVFAGHKSHLAFAVGKDIGGNYIVGDIAKMPHLLIAGTTGSGKSVCMNSIIVSLLYRSTPEEVRMIMIDPKVVELSIYNDIPHLLIPVVTDAKKAAGALQWAVTEMERRYKLLADYKVRDLSGYNKLARRNPDMTPMPQIVVIIDELADLMLVAAKEVENSIVRIAQKARAAGMHLVIATQRPSANVITGVMKANIPSRIAFAVSSALDSRIILDDGGAEKLVGKGDMLYAPLGAGKPKRIQGCFITDEEVEEVAEYVKNNSETDYSDEIINEIEQNAVMEATTADPAQTTITTDGDELLPDAVEVILDTQQASVSMLQRRLKLGYAHAARIVDEMEEKGIVGPFEGSKPRQLLITREQWNTMVGVNPRAVAPDADMTANVSEDAQEPEDTSNEEVPF
ncbi:MAG: DNA translocase FtsK [Oscillospiraceae bacterium]|nr:DNA translocase FtsK [Oscillospiraceae bacterium]